MKLAANIGLMALLALSCGCSRPQSAPQPQTSSAPAVAQSGARDDNDDKAAIASHPDMVKREGDSLILFVAGKPVARTHIVRTKDCEGFDSCFDWEFEGIISLRETPGGPLISLPIIRSYNWEGMDYVIIDASGRAQWLSFSPLASPDGCFVAEGSQADIITDGYLAVIDWCRGYPRQKQAAYAPCEPRKWTGPDTVELACRLEDEPEDTLTQATHQADGTWLITPPKARPDMIKAEDSRLKLQKLDAAAKKPDRTFGIEAIKP